MKHMKSKFSGGRIMGVRGNLAAAPFLAAFTSFPLISWAHQVVTPNVDYQHIALEKVISVYRDAYATAGMTQIRRHIERKQIFPDKNEEVREEIQFSSLPSRGVTEYASFYFETYSKNGTCHDCVVTRKDYSFKHYEDDWRATRQIRQALGQSLGPVCDKTACPASVEDWVNGKSDKAPVLDGNPRQASSPADSGRAPSR